MLPDNGNSDAGLDLSVKIQAMITQLLRSSLESRSIEEYLDAALQLILSIPWLSLDSMGSIYLYDHESGNLTLTSQRGLSATCLQKYKTIPLTASPCHEALSSGGVVYYNQHDAKYDFLFEESQQQGYLCIPLRADSTLLGMLNLSVAKDTELNSVDGTFLQDIAGTLGAIINRRINEDRLKLSKEASEVLQMLLESAMEPVPLQDQLDQVLTLLFYLPWLPLLPKAVIVLPGSDKGECEIASYTDNFEAILQQFKHIEFGKCLCGVPVANQVALHGVKQPGSSKVGDERKNAFDERHCCVPVFEEGNLFGIVILFLADDSSISEDNVNFLHSVASVLSIIIVRKRLDAQLVQALEDQKLANMRLDRANIFIRKTFGTYMSDEVVKSILDTPDGLRLGGDEKTVSVLMSDLRGFTSISERMASNDVLTMLNFYLGVMTEIITEHKGTIIEFLGDGILALFGAPITRDDDAQRAVACALSMQKAMVSVNARNKKEGYPMLEMGAGINTGMVIVGNIGSDVRRKYGVVGRTINLAARIESLTIGGQVLISEHTINACQQDLDIEKQWEEKLKGVLRPVTIASVIGIGGCDGVHLAQKKALQLHPTSPGLPVAIGIISGKQIVDSSSRGEITAMGVPTIEVTTPLNPPIHANLNITLFDSGDGLISDQLYGKVISINPKQNTIQIYLTSIPPEVDKVFRVIESLRGAE